MPHLKCIMFLSPDPETLEWVKEEIARPKYGGYWLCELLLDLSFFRLELPYEGCWPLMPFWSWFLLALRLLERLDEVGYRDARSGG